MMTETPTPTQEAEQHEEERGPLFEIAHKLLLGSIGAVVLAQEETEKLVNKLVERGELQEIDGKKIVDDITERSRNAWQRGRERVHRMVDHADRKSVEEILEEMDVPRKADIEALSQKITELAKKIDALRES